MSFECSIVAIVTSHQFKVDSLKLTLKDVDSFRIPFLEKHLCVDAYGTPFPPSEIVRYKDRGWVVHQHKAASMPANTWIGLEKVSAEWTYYTEDDVHLNPFPELSWLEFLNNFQMNGRPVGLISFRCGGQGLGETSETRLKDLSRYVDLDPVVVPTDRSSRNGRGVVAWLRDEDVWDHHSWIEFPCCFIRTELFKQCWIRAKEKFNGIQIESAYSLAWFDLGLDADYAKVSVILHPDAVMDLSTFTLNQKTYGELFHEQCRLTRHPYYRANTGNYNKGRKRF
jgi:hypothetical protein